MKYLRTMGIVASALLFLIMTACGGNNNDKDKSGSGTPTLTLSPTTADVVLGKSQTFTITATNTDFTVTGDGCTKNNSTTVVCTPAGEGVHELTVTATADTTLSRKATMMVIEVDIAIASDDGKTEAEVMVGDSVTFTVTTKNTDFTMTPTDKAGCVRTDDVITCTPTEFGNYNLVVTATANTAKAAMARITAYEVSISIDQSQATLTLGESKTFKVTTAHTGFDMDVDPAAGCVITDDEITCTPSMAGTYELEVTATADPSKTATVTITAVLDGPEDIEGMVFVEAGTFMMGCPGSGGGIYCSPTTSNASNTPTFEVTLMNNYYIGKYEVTQAEWTVVMGNNPSAVKGDNMPITDISWEDITGEDGFLARLNAQEAIAGSGRIYRLPTEAEWEYAARGGRESNGYMYSGSDNYNDVAWSLENSGDSAHPYGTSHPVGEKAVNELGIHDMSGNVNEFVADWWGLYTADSQTDPQGPEGPYCSNPFICTPARVMRGGSFGNDYSTVQVWRRQSISLTATDSSVGFRLALSVE